MFDRVRAFRNLHPGSWWVFSICLALAALATPSLIFAAVVTGLAFVLIALLAGPERARQGLRLYVTLALLAVLVRVGFGVLFGSASALEVDVLETPVAIALPDLNLSIGLGQPIHLLGATTWVQLHHYLLLGSRLAAVIAVVGLANTIANPRALLKSTPAALYPVATAFGMALNIGPQLVASAARVRRAQRLRADPSGHIAAKRILVPVLQDALERSLALAANMESRGFGSSSVLTGMQLRTARLGLLLAVCLFAPASYLVASGQLAAGLACLLGGLVLSALVFRTAARANLRTRYLSHKRGWRDWLVMAAGAALAASSFVGW